MGEERTIQKEAEGAMFYVDPLQLISDSNSSIVRGMELNIESRACKPNERMFSLCVFDTIHAIFSSSRKEERARGKE